MRYLDINHWLNVKWYMQKHYPSFRYMATFKQYINQTYEQLHADWLLSLEKTED